MNVSAAMEENSRKFDLTHLNMCREHYCATWRAIQMMYNPSDFHLCSTGPSRADLGREAGEKLGVEELFL